MNFQNVPFLSVERSRDDTRASICHKFTWRPFGNSTQKKPSKVKFNTFFSSYRQVKKNRKKKNPSSLMKHHFFSQSPAKTDALLRLTHAWNEKKQNKAAVRCWDVIVYIPSPCKKLRGEGTYRWGRGKFQTPSIGCMEWQITAGKQWEHDKLVEQFM